MYGIHTTALAGLLSSCGVSRRCGKEAMNEGRAQLQGRQTEDAQALQGFSPQGLDKGAMLWYKK
jgi:hypothetical protein